MNNTRLLFSAFWMALSLWLLSACNSYEPYARPYGYHRIDVPQNVEYQTFSSKNCPFAFQYPSYGQISRQESDSCWVDIAFPRYDLKWHITYRHAPTRRQTRAEQYEDYRKLVYKHTKKATQITETPLEIGSNRAVLFELYGNVGTPAQVFLSDSAGEHIFMMSFYYQTALKNDSLQPLTDYMKGEIIYMLETFEWKP